MDVRRAPRVGMVAAGICARLDGKKLVTAIRIGQCASAAAEIRIKRRVMLIHFMHVTSRGVRLPYLDQRAAYWPAAFVQQASADCNPLSERCACMLRGQIAIRCTNAIPPEDGSSSF